MPNLEAINDLKKQAMKEIENLLNWNKSNIKNSPEQCRLNLETIVTCIEKISLIR